ncbi:MAG: hypothetical protein GY812_13625 [Actinomycetia bacterium]|nr:hypothetical protein [Actinomycetes bacterium]
MNIAEAAAPIAVLVLSAVWLGIGFVTGWAGHRLPLGFVSRDTWLTNPRQFEHGGRFYERRLRIRNWKDSLPEAGALFRGGFAKDRLADRSSENLERFVAETRRAEYVHWANVLAGPAFLLVLPLWGGIVMTVFALVVHVPFVAIQRYNRIRLRRTINSRRRNHARRRQAVVLSADSPRKTPPTSPRSRRSPTPRPT